MPIDGITGLSADSIQDFQSAKDWSRDHEIRQVQTLDQMSARIEELRSENRERQKESIRNLKLIASTVIVSGGVLVVVVVLSGILQFIR